MTRTAIIGASGFIGRHLFEAYRRIDPETIGTSCSRSSRGLIPFDLRQPNLKSLQLREQGFRAVLIAAAKANVGYCEQHPEESLAVNVQGTLELIRQAAALGLMPIFLSSDYVFDGRTGGYEDEAPTNPSTEYGRQKQAVEQEIPRITDHYLILRLSKVYGMEKGDRTLLDEMAAALSAGQTILAASDMIFTPTGVADLVQAILAIQQRNQVGTLNVCHPQAWRRYDIAVRVAQALGVDPALVQNVRLDDIPTMAGRPLNTSMKPMRLLREIGQPFVSLETAIQQVAANYRKG